MESNHTKGRNSTPIEDDLLAVSKWLRLIFKFLAQLAVFDLEKLELKFLLAVLLESWRYRSPFVWLHEDKIRSHLTGIHSQNLGRPISRLRGYGILQQISREGGDEFRLNPNLKKWEAPKNRNIPKAATDSSKIKRSEVQLDLADLLRELDRMLDTLAIEQALESSESLTVSETEPNLSLGVSEGREVQSLTASEGNLKAAAPNDVRSRVRLERHTSDGQEAAEGDKGRILELALNYIALDGPQAVEKEKGNPVFEVAAGLLAWPNALEQSVKDCREAERTHPTTKSRAARLMDALKAKIGPEKWFSLFPKSSASFDRVEES